MTGEPASAPSLVLSRLFHVLDTAGVPYCILHGYAGYPRAIPSDVDCVVSGGWLPGRLAELLRQHREQLGARVVQWLQHEATAHYFVLAIDGAPATFLAFDASSDYRARGRRFYSGREILDRRQPCRDFWIPPPALEFGYYLVKRIGKGVLEPRHQARLSELYAADPSGCRNEVARFWAEAEGGLIAEAAASGRWEAVTRVLPTLRRHLLAPPSLSGWWNRLGFACSDVVRRARRWWRPTGAFVVLLGPDGAGKSSVADGVRAALGPAFRRTALGHFNPDLFARAAARGAAGASAPHEQAPRTLPASLLKAAYWLFDFTAGYWMRIRPAVVRSTLVVYDRYLPDAQVDPRRYRFQGPAWTLRAVWRLVPKPDLVVLLDAPTEVLRARKTEVSLPETARQREEYRSLVGRLPNGHVVDAARPLAEVVGEVERLVLAHMTGRAAVRLGVAP